MERCIKEERNTTAVCMASKPCYSCLASTGNYVWCSEGCHSENCLQLKEVKVVRDLNQCLVREQ